ncbi:MAG TPA: DUF1028 domain-containing protein [Candidatus Binatia bacterium]|nr:DUF1028 domain-containing protein [Candidatus Binatia bacterium]
MKKRNIRFRTVHGMSALILVSNLFVGAQPPPAAPLRPIATYSIVAYDPASGQMGVAVQSHWFSVGSTVTWAEAGIGAVATQSFVEPAYGPLGLQLLRAGKTAREALTALLTVDAHKEVRQVAMVDVRGDVAVHTGAKCIAAAGHRQGVHYSCQANMMEKDTVWTAMATAFEAAPGELVDRLLAALLAAEKEGGDIRGRQSAAILVVNNKISGTPWKNRVFDLRVEDHPQPLQELQRLVTIAKAYNHMNRGDDLLTENNVSRALAEYTTAMGIYPGNPEMVFWPAVTMAASGQVEESLPLFKKVFATDRRWAELLKRLPAVGQFPDDPALLKKILGLVPQPKKKK